MTTLDGLRDYVLESRLQGLSRFEYFPPLRVQDLVGFQPNHDVALRLWGLGPQTCALGICQTFRLGSEGLGSRALTFWATLAMTTLSSLSLVMTLVHCSLPAILRRLTCSILLDFRGLHEKIEVALVI